MTARLQTTPFRRVGRTPVRAGPLSAMFRLRPLLVLLGASLAAFVLLVVNLGFGDYHIAPGQVVSTLLGGGDYGDQLVIFDLRMPRSLAGLLVGASLGLSGAIIQTLARNPLASPDILGITWGAGAAATATVVLGGTAGVVSGSVEAVGLPVVALLGGVLTGLALYLLTASMDPLRLVLVGVGITAITSNFTYWLLTAGDVNETGRALVWLTGSLNGRSWEQVVPVAVALVILVPFVLVGTHTLGALQFDDDTAHALGVRVVAARRALLLAAVLLAAVATAAAGPIQFVALCAPQIALRLARAPRPPLLGSMALAAALVLAADVIARTAFGGTQLPVGIVTAILGAPYLIYLLARRYREVSA